MFHSTRFPIRLAAVISLFAATLIAPTQTQAASTPLVEVVSLGSPTTPVILSVNGLPQASNNFDRDQALVTARLTRPNSSVISVDGYWYQEYKLQNINGNRNIMKVGEPHWRMAFSSTVAGRYSLEILATIKGEKYTMPLYTVDTNYSVIPKIKTEGKSFKRGDSPFIPIAYNIAWAGRFEEVERYDRWFSQASKAGVNVARVWMASWSLGIEWTDTGLGDYTKRLDRAWLLDQVFLLGAKYGIGINLVFINHGAFSVSTNPEWYSNPYFKENGGPLASAGEFATSEIAWKYWERRLRYLVARYSAYPSLMTWEYWNEVNYTPIATGDLKSWIVKSNKVLDESDAYRTLRTNSWSSGASLEDWSNLDYAVTHVYDPSDPIKSLTVQAEALRAAVPNKPILVGEMGSGTVSEDPFSDPRGLHLHNSQWAATFVGFAGPASYWWWDNYIEPLGLWGHTKGLNTLTKGLDPASMQTSRVYGLPLTSILTLNSSETVIGWIRHNNFDRSAKTQLLLDAAIEALRTKKKMNTNFPDPISKGGTILVPVGQSGSYKVTFINSFTGATIRVQTMKSATATLKILVPKFTGDIAFRIDRV